MQRDLARILVGVAAIALAAVACARRQSTSVAPAAGPTATAPARDVRPQATAPGSVAPPSDSPLSKITRGMGMPQVQDILGPPSDEMHHVTGKGFIPYYYGADTARSVWYYKGMGRVVFHLGHAFGGGPRVVQTEYDPGEDGYR